MLFWVLLILGAVLVVKTVLGPSRGFWLAMFTAYCFFATAMWIAFTPYTL